MEHTPSVLNQRSLIQNNIILFHVHQRSPAGLKGDGVRLLAGVNDRTGGLLAVVDEYLQAESVQDDAQLDLALPIGHQEAAGMDNVVGRTVTVISSVRPWRPGRFTSPLTGMLWCITQCSR